MHLRLFDIIIIIVYAMLVLAVSQIFHRGVRPDDEDIAEPAPKDRALPWWAIGTSLIAANISAEQIIGMSAAAYAIGLGIAGYEWLAAVAMIVIAKYLLPVFLKNQIHTMPQFLALRYGKRTQVTMAAFWLAMYTLVSLTATMWLGATAVHAVTGLSPTMSVVILGLVAGNYALYVGLRSTHFTDVLQVGLLVLGGLVMAIFALEKIGAGHGLVFGLATLVKALPSHFHMIVKEGDPNYHYLPGLAAVWGGMWVIQFSYWGCNQYIVQRTLAANSVREMQRGMVLAATLKLAMPLIVVLPGIAAAYLLPPLARSDEAYPLMMTMLPPGLLGFVFVALMAAIIASTGSTLSSIAKITTNDVVHVLYPAVSRRLLIIIGRFAAIGALIVAMGLAAPILGHCDQAFQYIQEFTAFLSPGVVVIFALGLFWPRANETGALLAAATSVVGSAFFALFLPQIPFMLRIGYVFVLCFIAMLGGSFFFKSRADHGIALRGITFVTEASYNIAAGLIVALLVGLYWRFW